MRVLKATFLTVFAMLFLGMQAGDLVHVTEYGDTRHDHDGTPCAVHILNDDQAVLDAPEAPQSIRTEIDLQYRNVTAPTYYKVAPEPNGQSPPLTTFST